MVSDPISAVLSLVEARAVCVGGFTAGGDWAIAFAPPMKIKFFAVARGSFWLWLQGAAAPMHVCAGDVVMLTAPAGFVMASDPALAPRPVAEVFADADIRDGVLSVGSPAQTYVLGGHVDLDRDCGRLLVDILPAVVHLNGTSAEAARLQWLIEQLVREFSGNEVGTEHARASLAQMMFLLVLRGVLAQSDTVGTGLLRVLGDAKLAPALKLMHGAPQRAWKLAELAQAAGMSRTAFAVRFKTAAGVAPLAYLGEWRMRLAERRLKEGGMTVSAIARALGYASDAAFCNAFKRATGLAPRRFRHAVQSAPAIVDEVETLPL